MGPASRRRPDELGVVAEDDRRARFRQAHVGHRSTHTGAAAWPGHVPPALASTVHLLRGRRRGRDGGGAAAVSDAAAGGDVPDHDRAAVRNWHKDRRSDRVDAYGYRLDG